MEGYEVTWRGDSWRDIPPPAELDRTRTGPDRYATRVRHHTLAARKQRDRVLDVLMRAGAPMTVRQIAAALLKRPDPVRHLVSRLMESGQITGSQLPGVNGRSGRGAYEYQIAK